MADGAARFERAGLGGVSDGVDHPSPPSADITPTEGVGGTLAGSARPWMGGGEIGLPLGLLAAAGFLSSAGARVVDPVLHAIATDFSVGVPDLWVIIAAFTLPYGLNQLVLGPFGDRFGKLRVILWSLGFYAVFTGACALASDVPSLAVLRVFAGASSAGIIPVGMAFIGDAVPYAERQVTLSKFLTGIVLAQVLAGPVGGVFGQYVGWRGVFVLLGGAAVLVAVAFWWRVRNLPDPGRPGRMFRPENYIAMARHKTGRLILLAGAFDGMLFVGCFPFLAPYLHERFGLAYASVGGILALFGVGAFLYTRVARRLLPLLGEGRFVLAGGTLMSGAMLLAVVSPAWQPVLLVELMLGMGFFLLHGVLQAHATEILPQARATSVAAFACLLFLGQSVGALVVSGLIARFGYAVAFGGDAVGIVVLTLWLWRVVRRPLSVVHG